MKELICSTTAYKSYANDVAGGRCSHAYMLHLEDAKNLRLALKIFALTFFGTDENSDDGKRILNETLTDCSIYPEIDKSLNMDAIGELLSDSVLNPFEKDSKLYLISCFEQATAQVQNKLLKTLEDPPKGVYFLLGVTSTAPILDTIKSRVKMLTIPPFNSQEIFSALQRKGANRLNEQAAKSCGGIFGIAENMVGGGWFDAIILAALEICTVTNIGKVNMTAFKYGEVKNKNELLYQMGVLYHEALCQRVKGKNLETVAACWLTPTLIFAIECVDKAATDLKFNGNFQTILFDLMLKIIEENKKWLKLQA